MNKLLVNVISLNFTLINVRIVFLFAALVHLLVTAVVTLNIDTTVDEDSQVRAYYYMRWKLITCWFNLITLAYLPMRLYVDWKTSQGERESVLVQRLKHASDVIMTALLFPTVLYSDSVFWLLYNREPALLGPPRIFDYLPNWAQHSLHTVSFFVVILDLLLTPRRRPPTVKRRLACLVAFFLIYIGMLFFNYSRGEMVYPVMEDMTTIQLLATTVASLTIFLILFFLQWVAIDYLWESKLQMKKTQ